MLASARLTIQGQFFLVVLDQRGPYYNFLGCVAMQEPLELLEPLEPLELAGLLDKTVERSNEHGRICPKKSDVFIL